MTNMEIRIEMTKKNLKQWQVADLLGISESVFSRKLRQEMPDDEKQQILKVIRNFRQ